MAWVMYADDLLLLSASSAGLQELLDMCVSTSADLCLKFNEKKSHCMVIGPHHYDYLAHVTLSGSTLMWTSSIKYSGSDMMAGSSFDTDFDQAGKNFFASVNTILKNCTGASELIKLYLCESYCLPVLSHYAIESLNPSKTTVRKLTESNSIYKKNHINRGNR